MGWIRLKPGREKTVLRGHPWIFSGAVARSQATPAPGGTVDVLDAEGRRIAVGAWSPSSQIVVRVWTREPGAEIGPEFLRARLLAAVERRRGLFLADDRRGCRLVHAEADGLPGLVVDRYADVLVCQFLTTGAEHWKRTCVEILRDLVPAASVFERSDVEVRAKEGLPPVAGVLAGAEPPELVEIEEGPLRFLVDVRRGHKTGFYLDQRDNRARLEGLVAGAEVLNCFSYTGGFGLRAARHGAARVINVDTSASALALGEELVRRNGLEPGVVEHVEADVFRRLRRYEKKERAFDVVVLDPPKFAAAGPQVAGASRGYKDINLKALRLLRPGGLLMTFSCSGRIPVDLFQKIVAGAAADAGREVEILARLGQAPDHPVVMHFPESEYLKGLLVRVR
jgi:23S rRNA (cytosine1962-C5)-methyltransferase